ncbi:MAG: hypothetical protein D6736_06615 [Nitrospinota bacterium]|nr:MAG: hypothetical protein D6736_06615 [Nitrospinota bacterium]
MRGARRAFFLDLGEETGYIKAQRYQTSGRGAATLRPYSVLVTRYSLLVTHYSLLITRYSLLVTHYSLLIT